MTRRSTNPDTSRRRRRATLAGVGWVELGVVVVGCGDRQRGCRALQRASLDERRVHAVAGEPDRAADRDELHRHGRRGHLLLQGHRRGRGRQRRPGLERGGGDGRRHDRALGAGDAVGGRVGREGDPVLGGGDRQRRRRSATTSTAARRAGFTPSPANRIAQPTGDRATSTRPAAGTYFYKVTAEDAAGNVGAASNEARRDRHADTTAPSAPSGARPHR